MWRVSGKKKQMFAFETFTFHLCHMKNSFYDMCPIVATIDEFLACIRCKADTQMAFSPPQHFLLLSFFFAINVY